MGLFSGIGNIIKGVTGAVKNITNPLSSFFGDIAPITDFASPLLSGFLSSSTSSSNQKALLAAQAALNQQNADLQKEFAQKGIRWKTADAKAAGLHPLYAMGANTLSFAPSAVGGGAMQEFDWGPTVEKMGQSISRSAAAVQTANERKMVAAADALKLENMKLQNDLLRAQTTQVQNASNPPFPGGVSTVDGQGNAIEELPLSRVVSPASTPYTEPGSVSDVGFVRTASGGLAVVPSTDAKARMEDMLLPEVEWFMRNRLNPAAVVRGLPAPSTRDFPPPASTLRYSRPDDWEWKWSPLHQEFRLKLKK